MGFFDNSKTEQIKYLEDERKKLWERITTLENQLKTVQTELGRKLESESFQNARKTSEFRNRAEDKLNEANKILEELIETKKEIEETNSSIQEEKVEIVAYRSEIKDLRDKFIDIESNYQNSYESLSEKIKKIEEFHSEYPDLQEELSQINSFISGVEDNWKKSTLTLQAINKRKSDLDDIHREIFGYEEENEEGELIKIDGLKNELDNSYDQLNKNLASSIKNIEKLDKDYEAKYSSFESNHKETYKKIQDEIKSLLPNALTAGLSAAFSKKKEDEVISADKLKGNFTTGIYLLLGVSLIPFITSAVFLYNGLNFEQVIIKLPRIVLAIIPMYIPVLWFTYSANKKLNLSKRLIEEYAHKEVLSRTYEGLSAQIEGVADKAQSEELKLRLLSNFLQVTSENPGKLISNYEVSDHPIMEALEQSYKFQVAVEKLEGIPGLGKVAAILEKSAKKKLEDKKEKMEHALESKSVSTSEE